MADTGEELGVRIATAAESNDIAVASSIIREGEFIVFQQLDPESGEIELDEQGNFSVVLAEIDEETAVVCFTDEAAAQLFASEIADEVPEGHDLPAVMLDGNSLLDGLPEDCGLLINPGSETECYFPPGCWE